MADMTRLPCTWHGYPRDSSGCYPIDALLKYGGCTVEANTCFALGVIPVDTHGHPVPGDDPAYAACVHDKPSHRWLKKVMRKSMDEPKDLIVDGSPAVAAPAEHVALTEAPGSPLNATEDVMALLPKDGSGGSMITVMLALIAVGGGGAAWKFYQNFAKQKHEQKMKEIELNAASQQQQNDDKHDKCAAERVALEAKVSTLEARLAEAEKTAQEAVKEAAKKGEIELPFDPEEMQDRLAKLEKILIPPVKRKPGRPKKSS